MLMIEYLLPSIISSEYSIYRSDTVSIIYKDEYPNYLHDLT